MIGALAAENRSTKRFLRRSGSFNLLDLSTAGEGPDGPSKTVHAEEPGAEENCEEKEEPLLWLDDEPDVDEWLSCDEDGVFTNKRPWRLDEELDFVAELVEALDWILGGRDEW